MKTRILVLMLWITRLSAIIRLSGKVDTIGNIDVKVTHRTRSRRSIDLLGTPISYELDLNVEGADVKIHLTRNKHLVSNVPTLSLQHGLLTKLYLEDQEETFFYQDIKNGASFVVQKTADSVQNMFGTFHSDGNEYTLQSSNTSSSIIEGTNRFDIVKRKRSDISYGDTIKEKTEELKSIAGRRQKRATGSNQIELLIVCDYAIYKYWYDLSIKASEMEKSEDAEKSVRQYYAFIINGIDGMYKNIQTSTYTISVVFAGIVISKTPNDATWTEAIKNSVANTVNAQTGLENFRKWVQSNINSLPGNDHSMLFTRYDLTYGGSSATAGLAWTNAICSSYSQSIVEDKFDFMMITTAAHELGHSLSAKHDGTDNNCLSSDAYIMSPSNSPQSSSTTADHPWHFSSCSTNYFTSKINSLESNNQNCMKILSSTFDPTALSPFDQQLAGQLYNADAQCKQIYGSNSYMCRGQYNNAYSSICNILWCHNPGTGYCSSSIAGEGTLCGNNKWCMSGTCIADEKAPVGNEDCLYGDVKGSVFTNGWTCVDMVANAPNNCAFVQDRCCYSCNQQSTTTTHSITTTASTLAPIPVTTITTTPPPSIVSTSTTTTTSMLHTTTTLSTPTTTLPSTTKTSEPSTSTFSTTPTSGISLPPTTSSIFSKNSTETMIDFQKLVIIGTGAATGALIVIVTIIIVVVIFIRKTGGGEGIKNTQTKIANQGYPYTNGSYDNPGMIQDYINTGSKY